MKESKINIGLLLISILVCIVYFFIYLVKNDVFMAISSISAVALPFIPYIIEKMFNIKFPNTVKLGYLMLVFFGVVIGTVVDLYDISPGYDKIVHFFSGMMISMITIYILKYIYKDNKQNMFIYILLILIFNVAAAGFWEIIEYTYDLVFNGNAQRGLTDTMQDMISALLGSILFISMYTDSIKLKLK
jgi:hypothetical protein